MPPVSAGRGLETWLRDCRAVRQHHVKARKNSDKDGKTASWLVVAKGEGGGGGMDWEFGISRCKLLYVGWIKSKVLLYSTGNYIQYHVISQNGKGYEKEYVYIYVYNWITLLYSRNLTQHCKSTVLQLNKKRTASWSSWLKRREIYPTWACRPRIRVHKYISMMATCLLGSLHHGAKRRMYQRNAGARQSAGDPLENGTQSQSPVVLRGQLFGIVSCHSGLLGLTLLRSGQRPGSVVMIDRNGIVSSWPQVWEFP